MMSLYLALDRVEEVIYKESYQQQNLGFRHESTQGPKTPLPKASFLQVTLPPAPAASKTFCLEVG